MLGGGSALAQTAKAVSNPPELTVVRPQDAGNGQRSDQAGTAAQAPAVQRRDALLVRPSPAAREAFLSLTVKYTDTVLYNPATGTNDKLRLRTYNDSLVGPTARVFPGEAVRIDVNNTLPLDECVNPQGNHNIPNCFNTTNLHGHGLWVSPSGNSDNVLLEIQPGVSFQHEYNIPPDHPAGTFWYHPHRHGSTAIQVGSGMAGALIVMGNRAPTAKANGEVDKTGDIDTILKTADGAAFTERLFVMQQVPYACYDSSGNIKTDKDGHWLCDAGDVGVVDSYALFGPGTWDKSGRATSINGVVQPIVSGVEAGRVERWRFLHAGVRETIGLEVRKLKPSPAPVTAFTRAEMESWVKDNCNGPRVALFSIARDGLTQARAVREETIVHEPGYRTDVLAAFPEEGDYCVVDAELDTTSTINAQKEKTSLLAFVQVRGGKPFSGDGTELVRAALLDGAKTLPQDVRGTVENELKDLSLAAFVPHPTITAAEVTGRQDLIFGIDVTSSPARFGVNHQPFEPGRVDRALTLGGVDEWTLTSTTVNGGPIGHPFHIHVNPFQVVRILNPNGVDVTDPKELAKLKPEEREKEIDYALLKGVWKDTLFVKSNYRVEVRTRYRRYIGDFVLHCHILDHEDQGMMQYVRVSLPGSSLSSHAH